MTEESEETDSPVDETEPKPSFKALMSSARYMFPTLTASLAYGHFMTMEPILAVRLAEKSLTTIQIGMFFTILPVFYIACSSSAQYIPKKIDKRVIIILSLFTFSIACFLIGPS